MSRKCRVRYTYSSTAERARGARHKRGTVSVLPVYVALQKAAVTCRHATGAPAAHALVSRRGLYSSTETTPAALRIASAALDADRTCAIMRRWIH